MLRELLTHSLHYSKFVELTLDKAIIKAEECFICLGVRYRIYEHKIVFDMLPVIISVRPLKGEEQNKEAGNITFPASSLNPFFYHYQRKIVLLENFICMAIFVFQYMRI